MLLRFCRMLLWGVAATPQLDKELGAHPGDEFRKWMQKTLAGLPDNLPPVETWGELLQRMSLRPK